MPVNNNACIHTGALKRGQSTIVKSIPYPKINDDQILIKAVAYAANPTDWKHIAVNWGGKGAIAGSDVSGIVSEVGFNVKGFEVGDIVSSFMHGNFTETRGAFSEYVIADVNTTIKYDKSNFNSQAIEEGDHRSNFINTYEGAASVTLGLGTVGVSFHYHLGIKVDKQANASKYILIWGGATGTGILAIQIAKLIYGLKVITTASSDHHNFLRTLGADEVFDYHDSDVVDQIKKVGNSNINYALDTVSDTQTFQSVYDATVETKEVTIDNLLFLKLDEAKMDPSRKITSTSTLVFHVDGTEMNLDGSIIPPDMELVNVYNDFWFNILPPYISKIKHADLKVLKAGLESANEALDLLRDNKIKAEKIVFRLSV
ncbi:DEHA2B00858p [Debaryomyces hansenii CBS767]|uniref:DEHA2B00858p n=1 Tax=Debaryomyces hansenii (strain ATCC 36239 / CBS 767 / BCRC 21394 / JCM 1990 / NBRC 0083 / IGC 2968) TaxID=284592 RepID=Q6BXR4_DEBHA|nr:DEHA2B00858p [Debaryomyces hansenii CBS767]CAG84990.2 DEHA2B00858p [Debaryomyces hansenii CBS767]|eukprot:XP_457005.2 DEHA2B00858p [Debaryomyces hansenii CBS767]